MRLRRENEIRAPIQFEFGSRAGKKFRSLENPEIAPAIPRSRPDPQGGRQVADIWANFGATEPHQLKKRRRRLVPPPCGRL
jgi:hypothetical protein